MVAVEAGDFGLFDNPSIPGGWEVTRYAAEILGRMSYAAWTPGEREILWGADRLKELAGLIRAPVVSANLADASGRRLFADRIVQRVGGLRVGITGVTSESSVTGAKGTTPASIETRKQFRLLDPRESLLPVLDGLKRDADLVVLLAHMSPAEAQQLVASMPGIDVVIVGHQPGNGFPDERYGSAIVVRGGMRGQAAAHLHLTVAAGRQLTGARSEMEELVPGSPFEADLDTRIKLFEADLKLRRDRAASAR